MTRYLVPDIPPNALRNEGESSAGEAAKREKPKGGMDAQDVKRAGGLHKDSDVKAITMLQKLVRHMP